MRAAPTRSGAPLLPSALNGDQEPQGSEGAEAEEDGQPREGSAVRLGSDGSAHGQHSAGGQQRQDEGPRVDPQEAVAAAQRSTTLLSPSYRSPVTLAFTRFTTWVTLLPGESQYSAVSACTWIRMFS